MAERIYLVFTHCFSPIDSPRTWNLRQWTVLLGLLLLMGCQQMASLPSEEGTPPLMNREAVTLNLSTFPQTVAVLPLKNLNPKSRATWLAPTLTEFITSDLSQWPHLNVIPRQALGSVRREQWYQNQGFHTEDGVRPGRIQGARFIIQGGVLEQTDQISVNLQVIDVETGVVAGSVRADGTVQEFPILEQTVVKHLVERLAFLSEGSSADSSRKSSPSASRDMGSPATDKGQIEKQEGPLEEHSVDQDEVWLSLEKLTHQRLAIMKFGHVLFKRGVTIEMGRPQYRVEEPESKFKAGLPMMAVPVSVFVDPVRVWDLVNHEVSPELASRLAVGGSGITLSNEEFPGEQRWLAEQLSLVRRFFVRALVPNGAVKAVFSRPDWRTDRVISSNHHNQGQVVMPMWPKPLFTGLAEFPAGWFEPGDAFLNFDAVFVPATREELNVVVEWVSSEEGASGSELPSNVDNSFSLELQRWILDRWTPSISETLPARDYLPGNKRQAYLLVYVEKGKITEIQINGDLSDPVFARSLFNLRDDLLRYCPGCKHDEKIPKFFQSGAFRVQCTLVKDINALGLGTPSSR